MSDETMRVEPGQSSVPQAVTPMAMLEKAVNGGANIEVLERLMALSERWQANQAQRAFSEALSAARGELPPIVKNKQVSYGAGKTQYRYEDLADVIEQIAPALSRNGLSFRWRTDSETPGYVKVTCILNHSDGHSEETALSGPYDVSGNKNPIQAIGSVVTYLQRYTLKAALGIAAGHDDDGRQGEPLTGPGTDARAGVAGMKQGSQRQRAVDPDAPIGQDAAQKFLAYADGQGWPRKHLLNAAQKHHGKELHELTRTEASFLKAHMAERYTKGVELHGEQAQTDKIDATTPDPNMVEAEAILSEDYDSEPDAFARDLEGSPDDTPMGEEGYFALLSVAKDAGVTEPGLTAYMRKLAVQHMGVKQKEAAKYSVYELPNRFGEQIVEWLSANAKD